MKTIEMKTRRERIITNYYSPHSAREVSDLYSLLTEDVSLSVPEVLPWGGNYYGLKGIGVFLTRLTSSILTDILIEETFTCGDKVIAIGRSKGRVVATGNRYDVRIMHVYTFNEEDKICRGEFYMDTVAMLEALGVD
jgi:ketosteroid isomerase-like protein